MTPSRFSAHILPPISSSHALSAAIRPTSTSRVTISAAASGAYGLKRRAFRISLLMRARKRALEWNESGLKAGGGAPLEAAWVRSEREVMSFVNEERIEATRA